MITLLVGGREVVQHRISVGDFADLQRLHGAAHLAHDRHRLGDNLVQRGAASVVRIHELMTQKPTIDDAAALPELVAAPIAGSIEFRNLSFAYRPAPEVLHDITLEIPAGSSLAIAGPTGSGKSTLVSLIPRLQDAAPGMVLIDGRPIREYPLGDAARAPSASFRRRPSSSPTPSARTSPSASIDASDEQILRSRDDRAHRHRDPGVPAAASRRWSASAA